MGPVNSTSKHQLIEDALRGLGQKYRRKLVLDLLYQRVPIPRRWLSRVQLDFLALDAQIALDAESRAAGVEILTVVVLLFDRVIPAVIESYLRRNAAAAHLDRADRDSLRRGTGPAAVRDAIFRAGTRWPAEDQDIGPEVRAAVDQALHDALARRRARHGTDSAGRVPGSEVVDEVVAYVRAYAKSKRLNRDDEGWLLCEVYTQLLRGFESANPPRDVARWTIATAKTKLDRRHIIDGPPQPRRLPAVSTPVDNLAEVELASTLVSAGRRLERLADGLRAIKDPVNAAIYAISAHVLTAGQVDDVVAFLENDRPAIEQMLTRMSKLGLELSEPRLRTAAHIIKATLSEILL